MNNKWLVVVLMFSLISPVYAGDLQENWLAQTIEELRFQLYRGDTSSAQRRLTAILEDDPTNVETLWQLLYVEQLSGVKNWSLLDRSEILSETGPSIEHIANLAGKQGNPAFGHFVKAWQAWLYNAFPQALHEINQALKLDPSSIRYVMTKGEILTAKGVWEGRDEDIEQAIQLFQEAYQQSLSRPSPFYKEEDFHFRLGLTHSNLKEKHWPEAIRHYHEAIKFARRESLILPFSWNNMSRLYRELGQCGKAKEAAEKALAIQSFRAATSNKQYAEFCLEITEKEKKGSSL